MENIRSNKEKLAELTLERDSLAAQLSARTTEITTLKVDFNGDFSHIWYFYNQNNLFIVDAKIKL